MKIRILSTCLLCSFLASAGAYAQQLPNVVIIFADDLGYGDVGVYGNPTIRTPNIDRMAAEGTKFTQFYAAASVCTPSRAGLLTGRLPVRSGMASDVVRVLFPESLNGLPGEEVTIAEALKQKGYATAIVGKWHLGHRAAHLPQNHGFDYYFGIPYSNDMDRVFEPGSPFIDGRPRPLFFEPKAEYWNVPLMRNDQIIERPADQNTITRRYTEEAVRFIRDNADGPFFLYLAHSLPHVPLFRSEDFAGASARGMYGDVVEEIDWSVGRVIETLRDEGIADDTLVVFTSDNGPWLPFETHSGSAGPLRNGKGTTWEGGMRVPALAWWPGRIRAGALELSVTSTLDLFPTILALADIDMPDDRIIDGRNILPLLTGNPQPELRDDVFIYYRGARVYAARKGRWKAHFRTEDAYRIDDHYTEHSPPLLFDLEADPGEQFDVSADHADVIEDISAAVAAHRRNLVARPDQLAERELVQ